MSWHDSASSEAWPLDSMTPQSVTLPFASTVQRSRTAPARLRVIAWKG
jgi:hypothetical protein